MNLNYSFNELASLVGVTDSKKNHTITNVLIDSRKPVRNAGVLFCAIVGRNHDGHDFIPELIQEGITNFVVQYIPKGLADKADFIVVKNGLTAFQKIAEFHRDKVSIPVLSITGSNGKTTVKEWLYHLLKNHLNLIRSPKSFNSQTGVPLSLLEVRSTHDLAIIEAGISKPDEMNKLTQMIQPNRGLFLGVREAHLHNFESKEQLLEEKLKLFKDVDSLVVNEKYANSVSSKSFTWGNSENADLQLIETSITDQESRLHFYFEGGKHEILIPFTDKASIENACQCFAYVCANHSDILEEVKHEFSTLESLALRLEIQDGIKGNILINDAYNSDIASLEIALDLLSHQNRAEKILILSSIDSDHVVANKLYNRVKKLINHYDLKKVVLVGKDLSQMSIDMPDSIWFSSTEEVLNSGALEIEDSAILIKGARSFLFEKIGSYLQKKTHETRLEINLSALRSNLNTYRAKTKKETMIMCMVKAFGYGAGDVEVAKQLEYDGVSYFGVAYADEGIVLRKAGITTPILVMNAEEAAFPEMIEFKLEPVIYNLRILDRFVRKLIDFGQMNYPIHLELETGMNRLGIRKNQLKELANKIVAQPEVLVKSVFSHLSVSDEGSNDEYTKDQIALFESECQSLKTTLGSPFLMHICNTSAIVRFPEAHFDMVRLGVGLYGVDSSGELEENLQVVSRLITTISQIHTIEEESSIGYGRAGKAIKGDRIGVLPIGYADGLKRSLGNGKGGVSIGGVIAPIVGNVCMDMTMIQLNGVDCREGDEVEIFGDVISVGDLAKQLDTIPYEVFTSVSQRVKRIYLKD